MSAIELETISSKLAAIINQQRGRVGDIVMPDNITEGSDSTVVAPKFKRCLWPGGSVCYDDKNHLYFFQKKSGERTPLVSMTTFGGLFKRPFDNKSEALRCAQKNWYESDYLDNSNWHSVSTEKRYRMILDAWEKKRSIASSYGTSAHAAMEYIAKFPRMNDAEIYKKLLFEMNGLNPIVLKFMPQVRELIQQYKDMGYVPLPEALLANPAYGIAGQADLPMVNIEKNKIVMFDYKTNEKRPDENMHSFGNMLWPFHGFPDIDFFRYAFQLGGYSAFLMEAFRGFTVEQITIIWLNRKTCKIELIDISPDWATMMFKTLQYFKVNNVFKNAYSIKNEA